MKVAVVGLFHLGSVTAACLANAGHDVIAYDPDKKIITDFKQGKPPILEPGLEDLLHKASAENKLHYSANPADLANNEIIWVTFDTPVDEHDIADVDFVMHEIEKIIPHLQKNTLILISSQMPVESTRALQKKYEHIIFAYIPENLRLGKAIDVFTHPDRIVVGLDHPEYKTTIQLLLKPFLNNTADNIVWVSVVAAEMTKHALNAFLALSVTFINELAALCETVGASAREVEMGLKSEERIGKKAYLRPGGAIAGGTLMRDINYLEQLGKRQQRDTFLLSAVLNSNQYHKQWSCRKLQDVLKNLQGKKIAMLGLTYKAGTDTLRRSAAIETCEWLHQQGAFICAFDPVITVLPSELAGFIEIKSSMADALCDADAVVVSTEWPEFGALGADELLKNVRRALVLDAGGFLAKNLGSDAKVEYFSVGTPQEMV